MTFEITHKINTIVNDNVKEIQTSFNVEFLALEKKSNFNTYEIRKTKVVCTPPIHENTYLTFLENLDQLTYPIKIQTTSQGEFVKLTEYKEWLEIWGENTAVLMEEYDGNKNAKDILERFNLNVYEEQTFTQNKFKEPFWNLIFFNPEVDEEQSNNTTINWNIKSIGNLKCIGKTKFVISDAGESLLCFESQEVVDEECTQMINFLTSNKTNQKPYVTNVKVIATLDTSDRKIKHKSAIFEIQTDTLFHYKEEIFLNIKRETNSK